MEIYITTFILAVILAKIANEKKIKKWIAVCMVSLPLILVSGFRWMVGTDFGTYYYTIENIINNCSINFLLSDSYSDFIAFERGFSIIVWCIGTIYKNPQFVIFMISVFNIMVVINCIKKYSESFTLSVFLYITTMVYFSAFNGMRQWISSVFLFWAIKYIYEKNFWKYCICVLIAINIHISAVIMLLMYWIVKIKPFSKKTFAIIMLTLMIFFSLNIIIKNFGNFVVGTRYEEYTNGSNMDDDGVNIFRVLVAAVPVIMSFFYYKKYPKDEEANVLINFSLINFLFLCLATQSTIIARFNMYFEPYNLLLYPKFLKMFKKEERYLYIFVLATCFFAYMYLLLPVDSNLLPYRTIFNK